jgi:hypothetical protein
MKSFRFDPPKTDNTVRKISYDDILASLNMTLENGRLVITRNLVQENQRIGITEQETIQQQKQKKQIEQQQQQQQQQQQPNLQKQQNIHHSNQIQETPLQKFKRTLEEKQKLSETKSTKMFFNNNIKMSNSRTHLKQMQIS